MRNAKRKNKACRLLGVSVMVLLGVCLVGPEEALADNGYDIPLNSTVDVESTVTLIMDASSENGKLNASAADTNPDAAADVVRRTASVKLTNTSGYTVKIRGSSANLTGATTSNVIPSVATTTTLGQMENAWGWNGSIGDTVADCSPASTFKQMTTDDQELGSGGAESSATKKVTMCFGARIDGTKAADTYSNTVTLSVVAQPGKVATFDGITQMQQMTPAICKAAEVNDTAQLEDVRDGKKYWVTKLLDGNCWMSQNLALDLSTSKALTSADSDVESSWTPGRDTTSSVTTGGTTQTETYSWNLGDYVIIKPTAVSMCMQNDTGLSACSGQFIAVESRTASTDPNFYQKNGATYTATEYDAHYLVGNYYQWNAATAGTGGTIADADASGSICPKNWKLPNSETGAEQLKKGSFNYLLLQYGLANEDGGTYDGLSGTSSVNQNTYNIAQSPLFFVRGGGTFPASAYKFQGAGGNGYYWSSRAHSNTDLAYNLYFYTSVKPSNSYHRYGGLSLRCLVPTI